MAVKRFVGTPSDAALAQPFVGPSLQRMHGLPLGQNTLTKKSFDFDPWWAHRLGIVNAPVFLITGNRGKGKSTLMKVIALRYGGRRGRNDGSGKVNEMRIRINDRKIEDRDPEFIKVVERLHGEVVHLNRQASINLFDPKMKMNELDVIEAAINICEMVSGVSPLPRFQSLALRIGIWKMFKDQRDKASPGMLEAKLLGLTQQDIEGYYKDSNDAVSDINLPWEHIQYDASLTANFVGEVVHGGYGSIFGGESSLRDVLSHPVVLLDWTGVSERARTLLSSMLWKWQETAQRNADHDLIPDLYFSDEEHQALGNLMYTRYMSASLKEARARRTAYFMSTQHETDLTMAGEPGTEIRELSESIGLGIGGRFITQQPNKEKVLDLHRELGFSELDTKALTGLRQGHFFFMAQGYPPVPFRLDLTPIEKELVDTESAVRSMTTGFGSISSNGHRR